MASQSRSIGQSLAYAPTISLSWLWGLGFFYSVHVTLTYGWLAFVAFLIPNALGLFLFGFVLGAPGRDPVKIFAQVQGRFTGMFLLYQLVAVAITLLGFTTCFWMPLFGQGGAFGAALFLAFACAIGHASSLASLKRVHALLLVVGVGAAFVLLFGLATYGQAAEVPLAALDGRFFGLVLPCLVGFLLGPWLDIQHWQRVIEIHRAGQSVRQAYGAGALLFAVLLVLNAAIAAFAGPAVPKIAVDGVPGYYGAVSEAIVRTGGHALPLAIAFLLWAVWATGSMIESAYCASRWFLTTITNRSVNPLLALVPSGMVTTPLWLIALAAGLAGLAASSGLTLFYLMMPFATLFVAASACLLCEVLGGPQRYDGVLCLVIGFAAGLMLIAGYVAPLPVLLAISPLVAAIGALQAIVGLFRPPTGAPAAQAVAVLEDEGPRTLAMPLPTPVKPVGNNATPAHGFDGQWFVMRMTPTYDDTNSVGNVYFANYVRWVGKARELFFNLCMPDFDLATTNYYVLTRSFTHDFRREAKEFEAVTVRIRIAQHNRKFVTLEHDIRSDTQGILGRGEQSLMFVDTKNYRPLDIPGPIIRGFLPYWPKTSRFGGGETPEIEPAKPTLGSDMRLRESEASGV